MSVVSKAKLKVAISHILGLCYFAVENSTFRQVIGIPVGSDPVPFMANLLIYYFESKWVLILKKSGK